MEAIEITVVNNGYLVRPAYNPAIGGTMVNGSESNVFETFDSLVAYLKVTIGPEEGKTVGNKDWRLPNDNV